MIYFSQGTFFSVSWYQRFFIIYHSSLVVLSHLIFPKVCFCMFWILFPF
jgi:hypothetical protein